MTDEATTRKLVLVLRDDDVEPQHLIKAFTAFVRLVRSASGHEGTVWRSRVASGSNMLEMYGDPGQPPDLRPDIAGFFEKMTAFNRPELHAPPDGFGQPELEQVAAIASVATQLDKGMNIAAGRNRLSVDSEYLANVQRIQRLGYTEIGSIEGRLDALNVHRGFQFTLYRHGHHRPVAVKFEAEDFEAVRLAVKRRVLVRGVIEYDLAHLVKSMRMRSLEVLPHDSELPATSQVIGLLSSDHD